MYEELEVTAWHIYIKMTHIARLHYIYMHNVKYMLSSEEYHQYGRYWYIGMARVLHMCNTNMHGKNSAKTERLAVKACYYYYLAVSLSNKLKNMTRNHR